MALSMVEKILMRRLSRWLWIKYFALLRGISILMHLNFWSPIDDNWESVSLFTYLTLNLKVPIMSLSNMVLLTAVGLFACSFCQACWLTDMICILRTLCIADTFIQSIKLSFQRKMNLFPRLVPCLGSLFLPLWAYLFCRTCLRKRLGSTPANA